MSNDDLAVLEAREAALRRRLLGDTGRVGGGHGPVTDRLGAVSAQLEQLTGAIAGFSKLAALYDENRASLELPPASTFMLGSARAGDELKRATILSSEDRVARAVAQLSRLRELQSVLDQATQLQSGLSSCAGQLRRLEGDAEIAAERVLALHGRVERALAAYQQMVRVLSEKCVECDELLDQLQV